MTLTRAIPHEDPREDVCVGVVVVECGLNDGWQTEGVVGWRAVTSWFAEWRWRRVVQLQPSRRRSIITCSACREIRCDARRTSSRNPFNCVIVMSRLPTRYVACHFERDPCSLHGVNQSIDRSINQSRVCWNKNKTGHKSCRTTLTVPSKIKS